MFQEDKLAAKVWWKSIMAYDDIISQKTNMKMQRLWHHQ